VTLLGGVLGIIAGLVVAVGFGLQQHEVLLVVVGMIAVPILFGSLPHTAAVLTSAFAIILALAAITTVVRRCEEELIQDMRQEMMRGSKNAVH
jgi:hypothetical protein